MNSEVSFMILTKQILQRYSEANIPTILEKTRELLSKILNGFRESATKVYKQKSLVVPPGMQYLPYYVFCLETSELMLQKKKLLGEQAADLTNSTEYARREHLRFEPNTFMLSIAPLVYNLRYYFGEDVRPADEAHFMLPPTIHFWEIDHLEEGKPIE
jgi:Sec23/Sec24 helical domain